LTVPGEQPSAVGDLVDGQIRPVPQHQRRPLAGRHGGERRVQVAVVLGLEIQDGLVEGRRVGGRVLPPPGPAPLVQEGAQQHPPGVLVERVVPLDVAPPPVELRERHLGEVVGEVPVAAHQVRGVADVVTACRVVRGELRVAGGIRASWPERCHRQSRLPSVNRSG
jgi:hypothetical protein